MPIYEYVCVNCHNELETLQKISDKPLTECPHCGNSSLKRKASVSAFHLKGSGWYKDGYSLNAKNPETIAGHSESPSESSPTGETKGSPAPEKADTVSQSKTAAAESVPSSKAS